MNDLYLHQITLSDKNIELKKYKILNNKINI